MESNRQHAISEKRSLDKWDHQASTGGWKWLSIYRLYYLACSTIKLNYSFKNRISRDNYWKQWKMTDGMDIHQAIQHRNGHSPAHYSTPSLSLPQLVSILFLDFQLLLKLTCTSSTSACFKVAFLMYSCSASISRFN